MAAKRRTHDHPVARALKQAPDLETKYDLALQYGRKVMEALEDARRGRTTKQTQRLFPPDSIGHNLLKQKPDQLLEVIQYYSRSDIQQAMFQYAAGRRITHLRIFQPQYKCLLKPAHILPIALCSLFERGRYWPSLHGTISRYDAGDRRMCDAVIELDCKSSWEKCFSLTRPVVDMFQEQGAVFRLKFSGHCSVHVILPAECLMIEGFPVEHDRFFRSLCERVKAIIREPHYLDTSFYMQHHFLRLAYSINENTGLVSLPFDVADYGKFHPRHAEPKHVHPLQNWWSLPTNVSQRMQDFVKFVMRGKVILASKQRAVPTAEAPLPMIHGQPLDPKIIKEARRRKRVAAREFLPNEGHYDRMVRRGQEWIDLREFLLLEDGQSKRALRSLRHLSRQGREVGLDGIATHFFVEAEDLRLLWRWELQDRPLRYYARDDIRQAIFTHVQGRQLKVGQDDKLIFLQEPADLLPLLVYAYLDAPDQRAFPGLYCTNSTYDRMGQHHAACDLKIEFDTRHPTDDPFEAAQPVLSLFSEFGLTASLFFDGVRAPHLYLPYGALLSSVHAKVPSLRHSVTLSELAPHLKRSMRMPGAACRLVRNPDALSPVPYSVHPETGLACVPLDIDQLGAFTAQNAWLGHVQTDSDWWHIPADAAKHTEKLVREMKLIGPSPE